MTPYEAWIGTLPADQRILVQTIMAHVMVMVDDRFNTLASDVQRVERRLQTNSERIAELHTRLDHYETRQWNAATEAIEQFAKSQLPRAERDRLIEVLYSLARDVEQLKVQQANDDAERAN